MKKIVAVVLIAVLALIPLTACGGGSGETIYVYNAGEYMDTSLNDEFTAKTGIRVIYDTFDTNESMYALLKGGNVHYDVVIPSDYMVGKMLVEGMLTPLDFSKIPNYANIMDTFKDLSYDPDNAYSVPYLWGVLGIIYNTEMVSDPVNSWSILWDEKYEGNILMIGNQRDAVAIALKKLGYSLNSTNEAEILGAGSELKRQKAILQGYFNDQMYNKLEGESAAMGAYYSGDAMVMMQSNDKLKFAIPDEGSNFYVDAMCIPTCAQNVDAAHAYINFMLEAESNKRNVEEVCGYTPNAETFKLLEADGSDMAVFPDEALMAKNELYIVLPDNVNELYNQVWTELGQ